MGGPAAAGCCGPRVAPRQGTGFLHERPSRQGKGILRSSRSNSAASGCPTIPLILPPQLNDRLWHLAFNQLEKVNEQLVEGREAIFFGAEYAASAGTNKLPDDTVS